MSGTLVVAALVVCVLAVLVWLMRDSGETRRQRDARTRHADERNRQRLERLERRRRLGLPDDDRRRPKL